MAITLDLTEDEDRALRERAEASGITVEEAAQQAIRDYIAAAAAPASTAGSGASAPGSLDALEVLRRQAGGRPHPGRPRETDD